ncbi:MAG: hypothetical protein RQ745_12865 [Longimicrobiales bacterium]|nr:hypothetical protein [Longimicrobiales bacterium]
MNALLTWFLAGVGVAILEALGNLGEFIGAIGVVVSLIYLAQQLSSNSKAVRASSFNSMVQNSLRLLEQLFLDREFADFLDRAQKTPLDDLDPADRIRWDAFMMAVFRHYGNLVYQYRVGALDEQMWEAYREDLKRAVEIPSWRAWFDRNRDVLSKSLRVEIDTLTTELTYERERRADDPGPALPDGKTGR